MQRLALETFKCFQTLNRQRARLDLARSAVNRIPHKPVTRIGEMHPDLNIELEIVDREAWKTQIRNALSANPPDVVNWYAANRMLPYVDAGLFMDITDWWEAGDYDGLESVRGALTINDRQWGVPYTY